MISGIRRVPGTNCSYSRLGSLPVIVDQNGYINATRLTHKVGRTLDEWEREVDVGCYKSALLTHLSQNKGITLALNDLEYTIDTDVNRRMRGVYLHPNLAILLAMWCSTEYALLVSEIAE